jgi:hypothetical protein
MSDDYAEVRAADAVVKAFCERRKIPDYDIPRYHAGQVAAGESSVILVLAEIIKLLEAK